MYVPYKYDFAVLNLKTVELVLFVAFPTSHSSIQQFNKNQSRGIVRKESNTRKSITSNRNF